MPLDATNRDYGTDRCKSSCCVDIGIAAIYYPRNLGCLCVRFRARN